ncbi:MULTISPECIES: MATE family efflux transporter [unclassified Sphingosinithalassobacter]|uniref:MATE family efflux transporter n=1 Tax=unclassified Sphingosinithalassobacter TaxID=2676235 RepID=UPI0021CFA222|nr:MATE family efflux transporter [Sphingosinithalassobacter sp. CS137]
MSRPLSRRAIFAQAWPIMLGQTTVPLVGLVDTAVVGRTGDAAALAGVALGAAIVNFLFWSFGFLRMGMTGLTAQAEGAGDAAEVHAMLARGLAAGLALGVLLVLLQTVLIPASLALLSGGEGLDAAARGYVTARFLGAPAALGVFAINGWLLGLGRTRAALLLQIVMNVVNAGLDTLFVWQFGMGAEGVGLGTALAEWTALAVGLVIAARLLGGRALLDLRGKGVFALEAMRRLFGVNAAIMIRTVALLTLFAWFTNAGARLGTVPLAANHVLLQFVSVSAFVLDGFAFTAESRVGIAIGGGARADFARAVRLTGEFSLAAGLFFAAAFLIAGPPLIDLLTTDPEVRATARAFLPMAAAVPLVGMPAWLLDGVFIGAAQGHALRNAALLATGLYIATDLLFRPFGLAGAWTAFVLAYVYRAAALGVYWPGLSRSIAEPAPRS